MLKRLRVRYPVLAGFLLIFVGGIIGEYYAIYYHVPHFDKLLHFTGGAVAAWFVIAILQTDLAHLRWWKQVVIFISVAILIGIAWEWAEYLGTLTKTSAPWIYHYFHSGGLVDTLADLVADTAGALVVALWALRERRS